ncbi:hypothetical protein NQZ68_000820 [Dissostichus eleginoides]|nr:hypothetical protein NQZ68_000820 [Dissostichus eleginoides]
MDKIPRQCMAQEYLAPLGVWLPAPSIFSAHANMPVQRMRMRQWLENQIESSTVSGLNWVDKDTKMFSIPWKHAARHGWEMAKDPCVFKKWAIHTSDGESQGRQGRQSLTCHTQM